MTENFRHSLGNKKQNRNFKHEKQYMSFSNDTNGLKGTILFLYLICRVESDEADEDLTKQLNSQSAEGVYLYMITFEYALNVNIKILAI